MCVCVFHENPILFDPFCHLEKNIEDDNLSRGNGTCLGFDRHANLCVNSSRYFRDSRFCSDKKRNITDWLVC